MTRLHSLLTALLAILLPMTAMAATVMWDGETDTNWQEADNWNPDLGSDGNPPSEIDDSNVFPGTLTANQPELFGNSAGAGLWFQGAGWTIGENGGSWTMDVRRATVDGTGNASVVSQGTGVNRFEPNFNNPNTSTIRVDAGNTFEIAGDISGNTLTFTGDGTTRLEGDNSTWAGGATLEDGSTVQLTADNQLGTNPTQANAATIDIDNPAGVTLGNEIELERFDVLSFTGDDATVTAGFTVSGDPNANGNPYGISVAAGQRVSTAGLIGHPTPNREARFAKQGGGVLELTSDSSTFTGVTRGFAEVQGGTFMVNGTFRSNNTTDAPIDGLTVLSAATLGGNGTVDLSPRTADVQGTINPGDPLTTGGIGSLDILGDTTLGGTLLVEMLGSSADQLNITGDFTLNGATLDVTGLASKGTYTIVTFTGSLLGDGVFATENLPELVTISYNLDSITLTVIPEPASLLLIGPGSMFIVGRRRRRST